LSLVFFCFLNQLSYFCGCLALHNERSFCCLVYSRYLYCLVSDFQTRLTEALLRICLFINWAMKMKKKTVRVSIYFIRYKHELVCLYVYVCAWFTKLAHNKKLTKRIKNFFFFLSFYFLSVILKTQTHFVFFNHTRRRRSKERKSSPRFPI
jgi:hypothetical protein